MKRGIRLFEARVKVKSGNGTEHITKMFHIDARTPEQAGEKAKKYGRPISIRKPDIERMYGNPANLKLNQEPLVDVYQFGNPYDSAIAMDEMIWQKKNRKKRIKNREKDKKGY